MKIKKNNLFVVIFIAILSISLSVYSQESQNKKIADDVAKGILSLRNPHTGVPPSHWGHPGYEDLVFTYDIAVMSMLLEVAGYEKQAEEILDYLILRYRTPKKDIIKKMDTNYSLGFLKMYKQPYGKPVKSIINAFDISSNEPYGRGQLEYWTTPGPVSFLIFALLQVNKEKYKQDAIEMGYTLLAMQDNEGGVRDGDRFPNYIHTEPHVDACAAFDMLYRVTGDKKWQKASDKGFKWFKKYVYRPEDEIIDQGFWDGTRSFIFATDAYSWTIAGPIGDRLSLKNIKKITNTMLLRCLVKITVDLPDGKRREVILTDFTNPRDPFIIKCRDGFHPMGSMEWVGGVILALQKNSVRFWEAEYEDTAKFYKAIAEILIENSKKCFYYPKKLKGGAITFYATGQGKEVGHAWETPYYYVRSSKNKPIVKGGSLVGGWPVFPYLGFNPFSLEDNYYETYKKIKIKDTDIKKAEKYINKAVRTKTYIEKVSTEIPDIIKQVVEPGKFNNHIWKALEKAAKKKENGNIEEANKYYFETIKWSYMVTKNPVWMHQAKRDNFLKEKEVGGIIWYPWGMTIPKNDHELHYRIMRYPILNEIGTALWGLIYSFSALKDSEKAKENIRKVIKDVSLHQIPDVEYNPETKKMDIIKGYWNLLTSIEEMPVASDTDMRMKNSYQEVLDEMGLKSASPKVMLMKNISEEDQKKEE
ncbi:MAG: hypothetical protein KAI43_07480 [Candidatus Aureabacteria bacterium]|nr:hypothetical protein [Candidatus Auribacterota bacterium]